VPLAVEFHPEARDDFDNAIDWYNRERPDLGARFVDAVEASVRRAAGAPGQGFLMGNELRRVFVAAFPYSVVYAAEPTRLFIVAVAHFRRHPDYWKHRR
jgi:plasmid stabilization system protein ParE